MLCKLLNMLFKIFRRFKERMVPTRFPFKPASSSYGSYGSGSGGGMIGTPLINYSLKVANQSKTPDDPNYTQQGNFVVSDLIIQVNGEIITGSNYPASVFTAGSYTYETIIQMIQQVVNFRFNEATFVNYISTTHYAGFSASEMITNIWIPDANVIFESNA